MTTRRIALVAGATGFVGSAVARRLIDGGWRVVAPVRRGSDHTRLSGLSGLHLVEVDDYSADALRAAFAERPEVVFNFASAGVTGGIDPDAAVAGNVTVVMNLLRAAAEVGVRRFIHTGSCFEYAACPAGTFLTESAPVEPWSIYSAAKIAGVHLARASARHWSVPLVVLRLFGVYGPGEAPHRLLPFLINRLTSGEPAELSPGAQIRDLLFMDDAACAFAVAADAPALGDDGRVFNVCSGVPVAVRQVGETLAELMNAPRELLKWGAIPARVEEPLWIVGDGSAFRAATGWAPTFDLTAGLRATIAHHGGG